MLAPHEIVILQKLTEAMFPGAMEARVPQFIIRDMHCNPAIVNIYKAGLGQLGQDAQELLKKKLIDLENDEWNILLMNFEEEPFFAFLRNHTIEGMFSDPIYGGNFQAYGWRLIGYAGPRFYSKETIKEPKHPNVYYSLEGLAYDE